jgi:uncharacterized UBP type Zn finger protein
MYKLEYYSPEKIPQSAFGFQNIGSICYYNSLLQSLISCPAFVQAVLKNKEFLFQTNFGKRLYGFVHNIISLQPDTKQNIGVLSKLTTNLLTEMIKELRANSKDNYIFGNGQESASEALVLLLNLTDVEGESNPISKVFSVTFKSKIWCIDKREVVCTVEDKGNQVDLFYLNAIKNQPNSPESFSKLIKQRHYSISDYKNDETGVLINGIKEDMLVRAHDIIMCVFNQYGPKKCFYYPEYLEFPSKNNPDTAVRYKLIARINHYGSMSGGHYTADALRSGVIYNFNDMRYSSGSNFTPSENTYILFYHITE